MDDTIYILFVTYPVGVVLVAYARIAFCKCSKPSSVFPCERVGRAVVIAQRIAEAVVSYRYAVIRCQFVFPVCIGITLGVGIFKRSPVIRFNARGTSAGYIFVFSLLKHMIPRFILL